MLLLAGRSHETRSKEEIGYIFYIIDPGGNPREFRSRMYRTKVFSLFAVKLYYIWGFLAFATRPFIRSTIVDFGTLYICVVRRIDIFLIERIASMARMILAFGVWIGIMLLMCGCTIKFGGCDAVGKCPGTWYERPSDEPHYNI